MKKILIIGQSFTGKSDLLRHLVNGQVRRQYYPHTGLTLNSGMLKLRGEKYQIIEAPGIYTLIPTSENEIAALNMLMQLKPEKIIFTVSESSLKTSLLIMIQLAELGIPLVVNYQVTDAARQEYDFSPEKFQNVFNTEVVISIQTVQPNIAELKRALVRSHKPRWVGSYAKNIETILQKFEERFRAELPDEISPRFICLMLLLGNKNLKAWILRYYPPGLSAKILNFATREYAIVNSFSLANRWESLAQNIYQEIWQKKPARGFRLAYFWEKYSLKFFWDIIIATLTLSVLLGFVMFVGNRILVPIIYNELFNNYILSVLTYLSGFLGSGFHDLLIGHYGIFSTGLAYAFILLPVMLSFFFIYALLDNAGYINRLSLTLNRLLKLIGLNGYSLPALLFSCCKITGLKQTRTLYSAKEQWISLVLILFCLPCITQGVIILNLLTIIPLHYILIFCGVMFGQIIILLGLTRMFRREPISVYVAPLTPLHLPNLRQSLFSAWLYLRWYLRDIMPLVLSISLLLWAAQACGILELFRNLIAPLTSVFLDMPSEFADSLILGLFRKDIGAVSIYDLANNGLLNSIQVLTAALFISLSLPCLGVVIELRKQHGWTRMILVFVLSLIYAFTIAGIVNKILRI